MNFAVEKIKTHRHRLIIENGTTRIQRDYLIKWSGMDGNGNDWEDTWEPIETIKKDIPELWASYENKLCNKSRKQQFKFVAKRFPVLQLVKQFRSECEINNKQLKDVLEIGTETQAYTQTESSIESPEEPSSKKSARISKSRNKNTQDQAWTDVWPP